MPWGGAGGQNIEHPHTLAILSSFFLLQMHFSFIGKAQFLRQLLFSFRVVSEWYALPPHVVNATTVNQFKDRLYYHWRFRMYDLAENYN